MSLALVDDAVTKAGMGLDQKIKLRTIHEPLTSHIQNAHRRNRVHRYLRCLSPTPFSKCMRFYTRSLMTSETALVCTTSRCFMMSLKEYMLTSTNIAQYLAALDSGVFLDLSKFDAIPVEVPIPPHIITRGPTPLLTRFRFGLVTGEVVTWVGADRAPYTSLVYHGAEGEWVE
ncbi:hypothetical protein C8R44DRAFT_872556 [Mycena epipterygia]|nr:hypothetical protein C8R44DRAFT_872556 [Mycena epipterygia]